MTTDEKIDLYKLHKTDYSAPKKPVILTIKKASYLAIAGQGSPDGPLFGDSIGALYGAAFTIKMTRKFAGEQDYSVCKLEAQWWADESDGNFSQAPKEQWRWKLLIRTPDFVRPTELRKAVNVLLKREKPPLVKEVVLEAFTEGRCVQMLHVGPYEREHETIERMRSHAKENRLQFAGRHHEIYLSDPRRVPPDRLKTILRQPVTKM